MKWINKINLYTFSWTKSTKTKKTGKTLKKKQVFILCEHYPTLAIALQILTQKNSIDMEFCRMNSKWILHQTFVLCINTCWVPNIYSLYPK